MEDTIEVIVASEKHLSYVETILDTIEKAAKVRENLTNNNGPHGS